jgi:hypothetical protein
MILIRIGHHYLNLEYMVQAEDSAREPEPRELPPDSIRVTMESGRPFDVGGPDAALLRRFLDGLALQMPAATTARRRSGGSAVRRPPPASDGSSPQESKE